MRSKIGWTKVTVRSWKECQYCHRNIYDGEMCWKLNRYKYYICLGCGRRYEFREEEVRDVDR